MTYQAYLDNIQAKTGKTPQDFIALARKKGYMQPGVKAGEIVEWLNKDFGLGRGHAMAIVLLLRNAASPRVSKDEAVARHFEGGRAHWRTAYDKLLERVRKFGPDVDVDAGQTYISLRRAGRRFAILQFTAARMDVGIKRKGVPPQGRFEKAGTWNNNVTHRVRVDDPKQLDAGLISWLREAFQAA